MYPQRQGTDNQARLKKNRKKHWRNAEGSIQQVCLRSYYRKMKVSIPGCLYGYKTKLQFTVGDFQSDSNYVKE